MSGIFKDFLKACAGFFADKSRRRFVLLGILCIYALSEFLILGLARRTFVFYSISNGKMIIEDRMIKRSSSREQNITWYTEEAILGPVSPEALLLFPRGTRLLSLLFREGIVYINLSEEAALPPQEGGEVFKSFNTLYTGIKRNFSYVSNINFLIGGKEVYAEEFR